MQEFHDRKTDLDLALILWYKNSYKLLTYKKMFIKDIIAKIFVI